MARKAIVDKDIILDLLKKGETTQRIAEHFQVSRQAIDLHRKAFINKGMLPDKRAARSSNRSAVFRNSIKNNKNEDPNVQQTVLVQSITTPTKRSESLDKQIDLIISAFNALKRLPVVEKELESLKQENEKLKQEFEHLKNRQKKRLEQENQWMLIKAEDLPDSS